MLRPRVLFTILLGVTSVALSACGSSSLSSVSSSSSALSAAAAPVTAAGTTTAVAVTPEYGISGVVSGADGAGVALTGSATNAVTVDASGNFSFAAVPAGSYTVKPTGSGHVFSPVSRAETVSSASLTDIDFAATASTATTYTVSGTVSGSIAAGVVITLNGVNVGATVTDSNGNYSFTGLVSGTYVVDAALTGYAFTAPHLLTLSTMDSTGNNFTASTAQTAAVAFTPVATLPQATVGHPYSAVVVSAVSGGTAPYRFQSGSLDEGSPPLGMVVNPNGDLTGTASVAGVYTFTVCGVDATGTTSPCEATTLDVVAAPAVTTPPVTTPPVTTPPVTTPPVTTPPVTTPPVTTPPVTTPPVTTPPVTTPPVTTPPVTTPPVVTPPAATVTIAASPATLTAGQITTLSWSSNNATGCTASGGWSGEQATSGTARVAPTSTTTYTLNCSGTGGSGKAATTVTVNPKTPAPVTPTVTLTSSAQTISAGASATLKWSSKNATACVGSGGWSGTLNTSGSVGVSPSTTTTYALACSSSGGTAQAAAKINVATATPEPSVTLTASPTTITSGAASTLTWASENADSCTASNGWTGAKADSGTAGVSPTATTTYALTCSGAGGTTQTSAKITVNAPVTTTTASGTSWVYYNGAFDWPGDFDYEAVANYADTSGAPLSGAHDIMITSTAFGGWLPYAQNWDFNSAPYTKLTFALKPTRSGQTWQVFFVKVGDIPVGIDINVSNYGPTPVAGQWGTYTVPLADLGVLGTTIYKFSIQDQSGADNNVWYIDNVGFVP